MARRLRREVMAWAVGAVGSGLPSTVWTLARGGDVLTATRAAGTLLPGCRDRPGLLRGVVAHAGISAFWTAAFVAVSHVQRWDWRSGGVAGAGIACIDLEVIGARYPAIAALPRLPQWLDHVAFGAIVGAILGAARPVPEPRYPSPDGPLRAAHPVGAGGA